MSRGFSLVDLVFVLGIVTTVSAVSLAVIDHSVGHARAVGAARHVAAKLQRTRVDAVTLNRNVALKVSATTGVLTTYVDGNGDGVLSRDIQDGTDPRVGVSEEIGAQFPGVVFGPLPNLPAVDASSAPPGTDPIRLGPSDMAVFSPLGAATSGTLYLLAGQMQLAVRIFGETGRTRTLLFEPRTRVWMPLADR